MNREVTSLAQLQEEINSEAALLAYFYNDNCAPCKSLRPKIEDMINRKYPKIELRFINSEIHPEITAEYGIFSNPTLLTFFDRKEYVRKSKYVSIPELEKEIDRLYDMMFS